jgi:hypothetical protein
VAVKEAWAGSLEGQKMMKALAREKATGRHSMDHRIFNLLKCLSLCVLFAGVNVSLIYAGFVIDNFDGGPFSLTIPDASQGNVVPVPADPSFIGVVKLIQLNDSTPNPPHSTATKAALTGYMDYNQAQVGTLALNYGSLAGPPIDVDLTIGGNDRFSVNLSQAPSFFGLGVVAVDNNAHQQALSLGFSGPGIHELPFSAFDTVDFTHIKGIQLAVLGTTGSIGLYQLEDFQATVPEPQIWGLIMAVCLGCYGVYHRLVLGKKTLGTGRNSGRC